MNDDGRPIIDPKSVILIVIDADRTVIVTETADKATVVLGVEDPLAVAVVELTQTELGEIIAALMAVRRES